MEKIEDELNLPILDEPTSPIHRPKLKRLKKSSSSAAAAAIGDAIRVSDDSVVSIPDPDANAASESRDLDKEEGFGDDLDPLFSVPSVDPILSESVSPISEPKDFGDGKDFEDDLDPLFSVPAVEEGFGTLDLEIERNKEEGFEKIGGIRGGIEKEKSARKRLNMEEGSEEISKKRKKKNKADKYNEKPQESIRERRKTDKERKAQLEQIHAESQRLLRETIDASFKPVPLVQKPISSVLEKIRRRKLEVLKKTSILCQSDSVFGSDCSMDEIAQKDSSTRNCNDPREIDEDAQVDHFAHVHVAGSHRSPQNPCEEIPCNNASEIDLKDAPLTPISKNQETIKISESKDKDDIQLDDSPNPSLLAKDLNPTPDYLSSSSEEDNDKENIDPRPPRTVTAVNMDSSPEVALAKVFLDDEAEEEDDSDYDLMRFQENEEDDESDADEVLNDLIATGYKEAPKDHEKRNLLHQQWLEQQDAAGTDDILQRLKYGQKQRESTSLLGEEDEDEDNKEFSEECEDERSHDLPPTDVVRHNSKKAKQMIAQMFNDADDVYVQSDDEESEHTLLRHRVLKQKSEHSIISPAEDEHSREVFGLIKKLNIAPVVKKRGKTVTSSFDSLVMGGNSNSFSKSSFLNRATSTSLSSSHKQASTTVRAFIFGRDDSNSRSGIRTSENISDMDPKQNHPPKPATSNKFSRSSQAKSTAATRIEANSSSTTSSLFQILRHSSTNFDKQLNKKSSSSHHQITDTQVAHQFSAFKLGKRFTKVETRF